MRYFWSGFYKKAEAGTASGFSGTGKGNLPTGYGMQGQQEGPVGAYNSGGADDTKTDHTLLDRQRNPKDYSLFHHGQDEPAESNPHIIY